MTAWPTWRARRVRLVLGDVFGKLDVRLAPRWAARSRREPDMNYVGLRAYGDRAYGGLRGLRLQLQCTLLNSGCTLLNAGRTRNQALDLYALSP